MPSSIPVAVLRYVLTNKTNKKVEAAVCGSIENFIGSDGSNGKPILNVNEFRTGDGLQGLLMGSNGVNPAAEQWGTMALATTARSGVSYRTSWMKIGWAFEFLDFWDDFSADGKLTDLARPDQPRPKYTGPVAAGTSPEAGGDPLNNPHASLAVKVSLAAKQSKTITFLICWHFPNRMSWFAKQPAEGGSCGCGGSCKSPDWIGNYYTTRYTDAWDAAVRTARPTQAGRAHRAVRPCDGR